MSTACGGLSMEEMVLHKVDNYQFGIIAVAAVRYSIGRASYMPGLVMDILMPRIPLMLTNDLRTMATDCNAAWLTKETREKWRPFYRRIVDELLRRGEYC